MIVNNYAQIDRYARSVENMRYEDLKNALDALARDWQDIYLAVHYIEKGDSFHYHMPIIQRRMSIIGTQMDRLSTRTIIKSE